MEHNQDQRDAQHGDANKSYRRDAQGNRERRKFVAHETLSKKLRCL
jgi:hypothetical protein